MNAPETEDFRLISEEDKEGGSKSAQKAMVALTNAVRN
jgi:hypothetical protein